MYWTGTRVPLTTGLPPHMFGLETIRCSSLMSIHATPAILEVGKEMRVSLLRIRVESSESWLLEIVLLTLFEEDVEYLPQSGPIGR